MWGGFTLHYDLRCSGVFEFCDRGTFLLVVSRPDPKHQTSSSELIGDHACMALMKTVRDEGSDKTARTPRGEERCQGDTETAAGEDNASSGGRRAYIE